MLPIPTKKPKILKGFYIFEISWNYLKKHYINIENYFILKIDYN